MDARCHHVERKPFSLAEEEAMCMDWNGRVQAASRVEGAAEWMRDLLGAVSELAHRGLMTCSAVDQVAFYLDGFVGRLDYNAYRIDVGDEL